MNELREDRITKAYNLRRDIHSFLSANPHSTVDDVFAALPDCKHETLRKSIYRMRRDGDVQMIGTRSKPGRLSALTKSIKPESETRAKLRGNAKNNQRKRKPKQAKQQQESEPWRYVNNPDKERRPTNHGGQGGRQVIGIKSSLA